jgi:predicted Zn-dependent protease
MRYILLVPCILMLAACQQNTITGRKQLLLMKEGDVQAMALTQYRDYLGKNPVVRPGSTPQQVMVARVGTRIAEAVARYAAEKGTPNLTEGYKWEFNLVDKNEINAWCMPGGKVVVYAGILPVTQDEAGLAVVMGHEVAHAIARHGNERMSQGLLQQFGGAALDVALSNKPAETRNLFMSAYGLGTGIGFILPFSRSHELEADRFGLIFAAMAGYNPDAAPGFWERMAKAGGNGVKPPEFLSTHPSDDTRIRKVTEYAREAAQYYQPGPR